MGRARRPTAQFLIRLANIGSIQFSNNAINVRQRLATAELDAESDSQTTTEMPMER